MLLTFEKHMRGNLSKHFDVKEFHCNCEYATCIETQIDKGLVDLLEEIHGLLDQAVGHLFPIKITSAYRCKKYNDETPGAVPNSQHVHGKAADILVPNKYHAMVANLVGDRGGVGFYDNRLHIDVRGSKARWGNESNSTLGVS